MNITQQDARDILDLMFAADNAVVSEGRKEELRASVYEVFSRISGGGGGNYYSEVFTGSVSFGVLGSTHNFGRVPNVAIFDTLGNIILAGIGINYNTFDINISFNRTQSGVIILT